MTIAFCLCLIKTLKRRGLKRDWSFARKKSFVNQSKILNVAIKTEVRIVDYLGRGGSRRGTRHDLVCIDNMTDQVTI